MNAAALPTGIEPGGRHAEWTPRAVQYVVCDVDGTLVGPDPLATAEVVAAIARTQASGVRVGYATGRMGGAIRSLHEQLGALGPHIVHNGAEVRVDGHTVASWTLTPSQVDALLGVAGEHDDVYLEVYTTEGYHVSAWDERARPHWNLLGEEPRSVIARAADLDDPTVMKATFTVFVPEARAWLFDRLAKLDVEVGAAGSPLTPHLSYVNANQPGADKGAALRRAADHLGVTLDEVAAIGDATNDLPMLTVAGTAIAMGQAEPEVQAAAHLVVPDVDAHGVAVALDALTHWRDVIGAGSR